MGFKDKLVLYHILIDGLKSYREMSCKSPVKIIAFSEGGRYLAVAIANGISVYSTFQDSDTSVVGDSAAVAPSADDTRDPT